MEHYLSAADIKRLVSGLNIQSLSKKEEELIEHTIIKRRRGDGKISLRQIEESLRKLRNQNKISEFDRDGVMRVFRIYFNEK